MGLYLQDIEGKIVILDEKTISTVLSLASEGKLIGSFMWSGLFGLDGFGA
jgi:hypothetical protein